MVTLRPGGYARVKRDYPFHESLQGMAVRVKRVFDDGSLSVVLEEGDHQGSILIVEPQWLEAFS